MPTNKSQSSIYESFSMLHVDGTLMCYCTEKRAKWYVKRGLAKWVTPNQFQLNFVPGGHGKSEKPFYTQPMENKCVVCGATENLNKHHVVPYVFRSRLPLQYKESNHHDVLATCVDCHEAYEDHATRYKQDLAALSGVSINGSMTEEQKENRKIVSARNFVEKYDSGQLLDDNGNIIPVPEEKLKQLRVTAAHDLNDYISHPGAVWADKIMDDVLKEDRLAEFMRAWRQHFIDYANPQHLPNHWSVDHDLEVVGEGRQKSYES
jgi:cytochrome c553